MKAPVPQEALHIVEKHALRCDGSWSRPLVGQGFHLVESAPLCGCARGREASWFPLPGAGRLWLRFFLAGPRGGVREAWPSGRAASPLDLLPVLFAEPQPFVHAADLVLRLVPYAEPQPFVRLADRWLRFALCQIADRSLRFTRVRRGAWWSAAFTTPFTSTSDAGK